MRQHSTNPPSALVPSVRRFLRSPVPSRSAIGLARRPSMPPSPKHPVWWAFWVEGGDDEFFELVGGGFEHDAQLVRG